MVVSKTARAEIWIVRRFQGRFEVPKCMTMGPWIHRHATSDIDQTDIEWTRVEQLPWIGNMARARVALGGMVCGPLAHLPRPLDSQVHICHQFGLFLLKFPSYK